MTLPPDGRRWTLVSKHGLVLSYLWQHPMHTGRQIADHIGVTERTILRIIADLESAGYVKRLKAGRQNVYSVDSLMPLRHESKHGIPVVNLLRALRQKPKRRTQILE